MGEHHKKERMDWECEYCSKKFKTTEECDEHELNCKYRPLRIKGAVKTKFGILEGIEFGIGFGLGIIILGLLIFIAKLLLGIGVISAIKSAFG